MDSNQEQIKALKEKIIAQIASSFPEEKKEYAISKIEAMNNAEFVEFLKNNNLIGSQEDDSEIEMGEGGIKSSSTPFRMIIEKKIPSYQVEENKDAVAVLEINPISKAHTIIIPKKAISSQDKLSKQINALANKVSTKIKKLFNPKEVIISPSSVLGEIIINILPVYSDETLNSQRNKTSPEELEETLKLFKQKIQVKKEKKKPTEKIEEKKMLIPKRIP